MLKDYISTLKSALHSATSFHASPAKLGTAAFIGTLIGVSPFFGFHLILCILIAFAFRLNAILTYAAANISNPFFAPMLTFISYQLGSYVLTNEWGTLSWEAVSADPSTVFKSWLVGSLLLGSLLGLVLGLVVYAVSRTWKTPDLDGLTFKTYVSHIASVAKAFGRFAAGYARGKMLGDPVYRRLLELIPAGHSVLDLGGGQGFLALLLAQKYALSSLTLTVLDHDEHKIAQGRAMAKTLGANITFIQSDVRQSHCELQDIVCLIDVLHYFTHPEQDALLHSAGKLVKEGGTLYIRDIDFDGSARSWLNYFQETLSLRSGITRAGALHPRSKSELIATLTKEGFVSSTEDCSGGLLYKNMLLCARRAQKQTSPNPC